MLNIVWRNRVGYIVESHISYRVYFSYRWGIIQCFHLSPEGLAKAKELLVDARARAIEELRREEGMYEYV